MKNIVDLINENRWIRLLVIICAFSPIFNWIKGVLPNMNLSVSLQHFDLFGLITAIVTTCLLLILYKAIRNLNTKMKVFDVVSHVRNKRLFVKSFEQVQFFKVPNETDEQLWNRLPEGGLFKQFYKEEYYIVRDILHKEFKGKTINEIEHLLTEYYPIQISE